MTASSPAVGNLTAGFDNIQARGDAANGLVRVEVSGAGEVTDLVIEPKAMRLPSSDLSAALRSAVNEALAAARDQVADVAKAVPAPPDMARLTRMVEDLGQLAQRRMDEFSTAASELSARLDRA
ncbi:MAG: YbaB/EbfC family nucleoid-associated protein [Pseudonocardiales bacterium]